MIDDPLTIGVLGGIASGVGQEIFKKSCNYAEKWINKYYKNHQPQVQEQAKINTLDFLVELGNRLQNLEKQFEEKFETLDAVQKTLNNPDFAIILQNAILTAARTSSYEKHKLLAQVISFRIQQESETFKSITCNMAVNALPNLSTKHLKILSVMAFLMYISKTIEIPEIPPEEASTWWNEYLIKNLSPLLPINSWNKMDFYHLNSASCIILTEGNLISPTTGYVDYLGRKKNLRIWKSNDFSSSEIGKRIKDLSNEFHGSKLTSIGLLIGICAYGSFTDNDTNCDISKIIEM
ncbi:LPO_1073/Vpar_1526 family protein [Methanobacterium alcaliphilum]|uniref:LPO_1073/Vpar_1526 family protein n=1 Tax=Methanobacterium alcaliphilum TaxID=392018 RepID=UPI00200A7807|nr:LPO_1073/Vpar_1526 family protein [Methanobacterium alcaliphilum]MCK9151547.1 hypothetical protein [Methanobacterium alcaliphilum]